MFLTLNPIDTGSLILKLDFFSAYNNPIHFTVIGFSKIQTF